MALMSHDFTYGKLAIGTKLIDLSSDTLKVKLCMTNTTCDTERDAQFLADFTDIDEFDGSGYVEKTLTTQDFVADVTNHRAKLTADNLTYSTLGAGTRSVAGMLIYFFVTDDTDSIPLAW